MDIEDLEQPVFNTTSNNGTGKYYPMAPLLVISIIVFIVNITAVVANILIVYVIAKSKKLRTIPNCFLLNWSICNTMLLLLSPNTFVMLSESIWVVWELMCIWNGQDFAFFAGNKLFALSLICEWFISHYCRRWWDQKLRIHYKHIIIILWVLILSASIFLWVSCLHHHRNHASQFPTCVMFLCCVLFVHIMRCVKDKTVTAPPPQSNLGLVLVTCYAFCWVPIIVAEVLMYWVEFNYIFENVLDFLLGITYLGGIVNFYLLYKYDKNFQESFDVLCRCRKDAIKMDGGFEDEDAKHGQVSGLL